MMSSMKATNNVYDRFLDSSPEPSGSQEMNPQHYPPRPPNEPPPVPIPNYVEPPLGDFWGPDGPPVKAAGDVSLTAEQMVPFMVKASLLLPAVKGQGARLRIYSFERRLLDEPPIDDDFIRKMNYVVDALDRQNFKDANMFLDILEENFAVEMSKHWAGGLRLITRELGGNKRLN